MEHHNCWLAADSQAQKGPALQQDTADIEGAVSALVVPLHKAVQEAHRAVAVLRRVATEAHRAVVAWDCCRGPQGVDRMDSLDFSLVLEDNK